MVDRKEEGERLRRKVSKPRTGVLIWMQAAASFRQNACSERDPQCHAKKQEPRHGRWQGWWKGDSMPTNNPSSKRKHRPVAPPRKEDAVPLRVERLEDPKNEGSFSAEILRRVKDSPFFRPEVGPDGQITDRDMLKVASMIIAAADREIDAAEADRERLLWWNKPM